MLITAVSLQASGSYGGDDYNTGGRQISRTENRTPAYSAKYRIPIDRERYDLGKKVYRGKIVLPSDPISTEQFDRQIAELKHLVKGLPKKEAKKFDIEKLSGRLDDKKYEALKYYLLVRFEVSLPPA